MAYGIGTDRPVSPLERERLAHVEVGHTNITQRLAWVMVGVFLLVIALLPLVELGADSGVPGALGTQGAPGAEAPRPAVRDALSPGAPSEQGAAGAWRRLVQANRALLARLNAFEARLEDRSAIGQALRPPTQAAMSRWLGAGNERVYVGREGWLFYRPDVEYVTGRGFLDEREHARRVASASEYETPPQPDPRTAILQFHRDLAARGVTLIVVPTPVKPTVHAERLSARAGDVPQHALQNASYGAFVEGLERDGVVVFDPLRHIAAEGEAYLTTDTHWRPETMERVAQSLAEFLRDRALLPDAPAASYVAERREARQTGDTAAMLDLPEGQTLYPPERVMLRFIVDPSGEPWRSSRSTDVLLLGDSFTNIYSLASMGWGEASGFAEQLSYALQRPVDRIVQNDQGAHATRGLLARDVDRLTGKRVVIWQFAARELAFGDWKIIELP